MTEFVSLKQHGQEQRLLTAELQQRAGEMETEIYLRAQEIQQRTTELEKMNLSLQSARDQALEASNLKSAFVATISHELRTPLTGLLGFLELVMHSLLDEEQRLLVATASESVQSKLRFVRGRSGRRNFRSRCGTDLDFRANSSDHIVQRLAVPKFYWSQKYFT